MPMQLISLVAIKTDLTTEHTESTEGEGKRPRIKRISRIKRSGSGWLGRRRGCLRVCRIKNGRRWAVTLRPRDVQPGMGIGQNEPRMNTDDHG